MDNFDLRKFVSGKTLLNEDYDTGGYVEAMNPELFDHIDEVIRIFKEWKDGPMTEPGMIGYAKDDLVDYIQMKIRNA
jgi:hypothetical protein